MDDELRALMEELTPKVNPDIVEGLAVKHIPHLEGYVHSVFEGVAKGFPPGLNYLGCERCTPQEEFLVATRKQNTKRRYDVARTDLYMMKYKFGFEGKELPPKYVYLPYVSTAGTITIGGSRFVMSPVLSDKVISVGTNSIFVRLLRDKLTFERLPHNVMINEVRETIQVVWSTAYHLPQNAKKMVKTVKCEIALTHYLFAKYGFTETFRRFGGGCKPIVGGAEINNNAYPTDKWIIIRSTQVKPRGLGKFLNGNR